MWPNTYSSLETPIKYLNQQLRQPQINLLVRQGQPLLCHPSTWQKWRVQHVLGSTATACGSCRHSTPLLRSISKEVATQAQDLPKDEGHTWRLRGGAPRDRWDPTPSCLLCGFSEQRGAGQHFFCTTEASGLPSSHVQPDTAGSRPALLFPQNHLLVFCENFLCKCCLQICVWPRGD